jgi:hypothetical protein
MLPELTAISLSLFSLHFPYTGQNQFNPGIHLEAENVRVGGYLNSRDHFTGYVGYSIPIARKEIAGVEYKLGVLAALGSGYQSPIIGGLEFMVGDHVKLLAAPGMKGYSQTVVGFALRFPIKE